MSKYCPMCDAVTNCTDNCKLCLEEENENAWNEAVDFGGVHTIPHEKESEMIEVGSRVKYIRKDTPEDRKSGFYPPRSTFGKVVEVFDDTIRVQWDYCTKGDGLWFCGHEDVEVVYSPSSGQVVAIRIYLENGHIPMADLAFADKSVVTIEWANVKEREFYAPYIDAYTLIYDTRPKASFTEWIKEAHK